MQTHSHEGCLGERGVMRVVQGYQIKETDSKAELRQGAHNEKEGGEVNVKEK